MNGMILNLQRFSTEDGPGIRSTVFFKGCPLHCAWCHNPESISARRQLTWIDARCLGCDACLSSCRQKALTRQANEIRIDREICQVCEECVEACPGGALEMLGREVSIEELADELEKDRTFYDQSGGGVTLSGGEPLRQPQFALALMEELHRRGIQTALDTCCVCDTQLFESAVKLADVLLLDLKIMDADAHRNRTGVDNELILRNIQTAADLVRRNPVKRLWVRTPLIPDATATQENLENIGVFIRENITDVLERWELCAFNNLCRDKYKRLNMTWAYEHSQLITADELAVCAGWAAASGIDARLVLPTGATRLAQTTIESGGEK